jgi:hypothetical protein
MTFLLKHISHVCGCLIFILQTCTEGIKLIVSVLRREHILQEVEKEKATQGRSRGLQPYPTI